jgi:hypothetical protein
MLKHAILYAITANIMSYAAPRGPSVGASSYVEVPKFAKNFAEYAESTNSSTFVIFSPSSVNVKNKAYSFSYAPIFVFAVLEACMTH